MKKSIKGASLISMGILIGLIGVVAIGAVSVLGDQTKTTFINVSSDLNYAINKEAIDAAKAAAALPKYHTCNEMFDDGVRLSGVYDLNVNGTKVPIFCYMWGNNGFYTGGWSAVSFQYESNMVPWGAGVSSDRNPATYVDTSFSLSLDQVPDHSSIMFSRGYGSLAPIPGDAKTILSWFQSTTNATAPTFLLEGITPTSKVYRVYAVSEGKFTSNANTYVGQAGVMGLSVVDQSDGLSDWTFNEGASPSQNAGAIYSSSDYYNANDSLPWRIYVR